MWLECPQPHFLGDDQGWGYVAGASFYLASATVSPLRQRDNRDAKGIGTRKGFREEPGKTIADSRLEVKRDGTDCRAM
jgi:hypothetical protein